jgi:hypothetical protein
MSYDAFNEPGFDYNKPSDEDYSPKYYSCHSFQDVNDADLRKFESVIRNLQAGSQWQAALAHAATLVHQTGTNNYLDMCLAHDVAVAFMCRIAQSKTAEIRLGEYWGWASNDEIVTLQCEGHVALTGVKTSNNENDLGIMLVESYDGTQEGAVTRIVPFSAIHEIEILWDDSRSDD